MPDKREEKILNALREIDRAKTCLGHIEHYTNEIKTKIDKAEAALKELFGQK